MRAAGETVINLSAHMRREGIGGAADRAWAAELRTTPAHRTKADQPQHLGHVDLSAELTVIDARHGSLDV